MEPALKKALKRKKKLTPCEISSLASLSEEKLLKISENLNTSQKEQIYQALCTPKVPKWIEATVAIHKSTCELKATLPKLKGTNNYKKIVEMIMVSAGDFIPPKQETVKVVHDMIKSFVQENSKLAKRVLEEKFRDFIKKYKGNCRGIGKFEKSDEESQSDNEKPKGEDMKNVERLQFNDERTREMTESQYFSFTECRKASFLKYGKEKFMKWGKLKHSPKTYSWIAREKIFEIIEFANKNRNLYKLQPLSSPLEISEILYN